MCLGGRASKEQHLVFVCFHSHDIQNNLSMKWWSQLEHWYTCPYRQTLNWCFLLKWKYAFFTTSTTFLLTRRSNRKRPHIFDLPPPVFAHPSVPAASVSVHGSLVRRRTLVWIAAKYFIGLRKKEVFYWFTKRSVISNWFYVSIFVLLIVLAPLACALPLPPHIYICILSSICVSLVTAMCMWVYCETCGSKDVVLLL